MYKELTEVERSFRNLKDVLAMRPIHHRVEPRVKAHIFVAALALLVQRLLQRRLAAAGVDLSAERAMETLQTIRHVTFRLDGQTRSGISAASPRAQQVLRALGLRRLRPPDPPPTQASVL